MEKYAERPGCWRGHDPERTRVDKGGTAQCLDCHAIRMRAVRAGRRARKRPYYQLNLAEFKRLKRRSLPLTAQLAGLSLDTLTVWVYPERARRAGRLGLANAEGARALAESLEVPFDRLWIPSKIFVDRRTKQC